MNVLPSPSAAATSRPTAPLAKGTRPTTVTLLVPTLNEIVGMKAIMPLIQRAWVDQIIILDGGSTDGTIEWARYQDYLGLALCLGIAALGMSRDLFLGCWFVLMYAPILRVFTEHVHDLYAMPPAAIILAEAVESLWLRLKALPNLVRVRRALACLLVLIGLDQALNIYGAYRVNHTAYRGIDDVADWFVRNMPKDSAVVTNVIHGEEIKWHSGNHIEVYWTQNTVSPINAASWTNRPRSRNCWRGAAPALCTFSTSISTTRRTRPTFTVISTSTRRRSPGATEGNSISRTSVRSLTCQNLPMLIFGRQSEAGTRPLGGSGSGGRVFEGFGEQGRRKGY